MSMLSVIWQASWAISFPNGALELVNPLVFLLAPLPLLLVLFSRPFQSRFEAVHVPFFNEMTQAAQVKPSTGAVILHRGWLERGLGILVWLLLLAALARPQWVEPPLERIQPGRDLLLAVDISQSMGERDFVTADGQYIERLSGVKAVLDQFIALRKGDRIGLVVISDGAYLHVPFTLDHDLLRQMLGRLQIGMAGERTRIGDAIGLAIKLFDESQAKHKVMIVLSDGNDTGSTVPPETAATLARQRGVTLHAVAIGDPSTGGNDKLDLATLQEISRIGLGSFALGIDQHQLEAIYSHLNQLEKQDFTTLSYRLRQPLFHWPLGMATGLLLIWQLVAGLRVQWQQRARS
tara:strand:+ start:4289 stop:5335 length:1047 start_codon:yes stop_codon:yes gene_type:complete